MIRRAYGAAFSDDEIDDLYSSAWLGTLRALERRHANLGDEEIRSYLLTAVANHASKELRRRRRKPIAPLEAAGAVADGTATPEDSAAAEESSRVTRDLLASLPPRRRAVMLLRYGWGLDPAEVCGLVKGLSPRAYRKEITKGVDELTRKIKLVEEGRWCAEREPLLKAYAAGLADGEEQLQVRQHLAHCRHCHEFVGKLTGHLHDLGAAVLMPSALEAVNGDSTLFERLGEIAERARDGAIGGASRPEASDALATVAGARGAGVAGAGVIAKVAGLGTAGKLVLACIGGGAAVTACVAAGIGPVTVGGDEKQAKIEHVVRAVKADPPRDLEPATTGAPKPMAPPPDRAEEQRDDTEQVAATQTAPVIDPDTPPQEQEFGIAAAATPAPSAPPEASGSGGGGGTSAAVQQEFGP